MKQLISFAAGRARISRPSMFAQALSARISLFTVLFLNLANHRDQLSTPINNFLSHLFLSPFLPQIYLNALIFSIDPH